MKNYFYFCFPLLLIFIVLNLQASIPQQENCSCGGILVRNCGTYCPENTFCCKACGPIHSACKCCPKATNNSCGNFMGWGYAGCSD